ncbi:protein-glutamate methylesterase/protein-glutamine glutaminase [Candidatus Viadribacter manganicus]|uniref:Protein-glutamate methylesterase/protein-glutamine glutaminase n=1 Tax=Candidatus Viadribacter manganicus TaxID=1759059 RepID=A0A1B1AGK7_9PROT|nr:chemotaxis response regulator protein-glutamate methylesterase [Candidatus Viadribacter manganicus]ANP45675.1 chemotaxis response regulator protein-glutamate methylesterase [Candidatus Viadribacter manganicus]
MSAVRVLIVDDSATIRGLIRRVLSKDSEILVVGEAGDPLEARQAIKELNPDVVTLDVEMPHMSGIEFLEKIMRLRPTPVIMVSTLTQQGAAISIQALEIGAVDCVGKPDFHDLCEKVKAAARARVRPLGDHVAQAPKRPNGYRPSSRILAIGSSTGGVEALLTMLSSFPENCPPTLITQHMPASFTTSFAARLDRLCAPQVREAVDGAPILPGHVYLAPGGAAHLEAVGGANPRCRLVEAGPVNGHRPSVDVLFASVCAQFGKRAVGVILTGMGADGAKGLKAMREAGAATIGQNEATSVVYGMPRAAFELGAVERQLPLGAIGPAALDLCALELKGAA